MCRKLFYYKGFFISKENWIIVNYILPILIFNKMNIIYCFIFVYIYIHMYIYNDTWMYRIWLKKTSKDKNNPGANKGNIAQLTRKNIIRA